MATVEYTSTSDESSSEESSDSSSRLFFFGKIPQLSEENKTQNETDTVIFKKLDQLYLCGKTRPAWLREIDSDESSDDDKFPILPFSKESRQIYNKIRSSWQSKLTIEEKHVLFGSDVSDSSEEGFTVLCKSCKPKITQRIKLPDKFRKSMFRKLKCLITMKESSRLEKDRKAKISNEESAKEPKDVMKNIIYKAIKELQEDLSLDDSSEFFNTLKLKVPPESTTAVPENAEIPINKDYEHHAEIDGDEKILFEEATPCFKKSAKTNSAIAKKFIPAKEFVKKDYLKPDKNIKIRFKNELSSIKKINILEKLDKNDLKELKNYFFPVNCSYENKIMEYDIKNEAQYNGLPLRKNEFIDAIDNIIGAKEYTIAAGKLFDSLETNQTIKEGVIWWDQFLDAILASGKPLYPEYISIIAGEVKTKFKIFSKSPIIKVIHISRSEIKTVVAVARLGQVAVMDENLKQLHSYKVFVKHTKWKSSCWLTDACHSAKTETLFIVASSRCLYLYNTSRYVHKLVQIVSGIWEIPECINYTELEKNKGLLLTGDTKGCIISYYFKQTNKSFFKYLPSKDGGQRYFWQDIINQPEWVEIIYDRNVHNDIIVHLEYIKKSDCIISCSLDSKVSVAIRQRQPNRIPYIFAVEKGVKYFCIDNNLGLLATISGDIVVRLWDPVNIARPIGLLKGHKAPVLDVVLVTNRRIAISYAENKELKVWDVDCFTCIQTVNLIFENIPYKTHVLLNLQTIYVDYQIETEIRNLSSENSSKLTINDGNSQYKNILKHLLIINFNNIKLLKINNDNIKESYLLNEQIISENLSNETEREENFEVEILDIIDKYCSDDNVTYYGHHKGNEFLEDFVKEGTPHLALQLNELLPINLHK